MREDQGGRPVVVDGPAGREQIGDDVVPGAILSQIVSHPFFKGRFHQSGANIGGPFEDGLFPVAAPVFGVLVGIEQPIDQA